MFTPNGLLRGGYKNLGEKFRLRQDSVRLEDKVSKLGLIRIINHSGGVGWITMQVFEMLKRDEYLIGIGIIWLELSIYWQFIFRIFL